MCGHPVLQAGAQALEEPHVSRSGQDLGRSIAMSLDGVLEQPSPAGTPVGEHCTSTAITMKHRSQVMILKTLIMGLVQNP